VAADVEEDGRGWWPMWKIAKQRRPTGVDESDVDAGSQSSRSPVGVGGVRPVRCGGVWR
jgi:hypothetical protein